jgi:hypothetical protein
VPTALPVDAAEPDLNHTDEVVAASDVAEVTTGWRLPGSGCPS